MKYLTLLLAFVAISIFSIGCGDDTSTTPDTTDSQSEEGGDDHDGHDHDGDDHDGHDHASHDHTAPHGGQLIEIGPNHEFHGELVDDHKTETVTIYLMDGDMKPLSKNQPSVTLNLTVDSDTQSFELMSNESGGPSEYTSKDEQLMKMIDAEGVKGKLRVSIDGKPYSGTFSEHDHDHEGHDHDGGDEHAGHDH